MKAASLVPRMMLSAPSALLVLLMVISTASANFIDTSPMLLFSSRHATLLDPQLHSASRAGPAADPREIARALTSDKAALCGTAAEQGRKKVENVVLIEIEDFTHSTLSSLSSSHVLRRRALSAPFQLTFQHVSASPGNAAREMARQINKACSSQTLLQKLTGGKKQAASRVLRVVLPQHLLEQQDLLAQHLEQYSDDLIIITSAPSLPRVSKRALLDDEDGLSDLDRGLFHKYQFFSSGLLLALLITFIILIPIAYFTINLLASIESPEPRPAKDSASSKKNN
ncbi:hypothetical protein CBOM_03875 [Ceraceosorus bombacis]|uniref:Protein BIG1 n=1 Tax=Ceraceosorus bombacis TaxID=401625 RepID=A0A0N7LA47_9BASI|nr:hypothetical protein CBOM_03875 [Ceraceosorus bombacis]